MTKCVYATIGTLENPQNKINGRRHVMGAIRLGFAPTRRSIFSAPDGVKFRKLTADRLRELGVDFVDIDNINEEGLLYSEKGPTSITAWASTKTWSPCCTRLASTSA